MSVVPNVGLGEPETEGKQSLFQAPTSNVSHRKSARISKETENKKQKRSAKKEDKAANDDRRIRVTTQLTPKALSFLQQWQHRHRLQTGRTLPLWKAVSQIIEQRAEQRPK